VEGNFCRNEERGGRGGAHAPRPEKQGAHSPFLGKEELKHSLEKIWIAWPEEKFWGKVRKGGGERSVALPGTDPILTKEENRRGGPTRGISHAGLMGGGREGGGALGR